MTIPLSLLLFTIIVALLFDVFNGFHDAANSIATIVSTQALKPHLAVLWAAFFNVFAMFIFPPEVANTVSKIVKINPQDSIYIWVIFSGLIGAILWDLLTWWLKLPTSSSHALIGGLSGSAIVYAGFESLRIDLLLKTMAFIVIAPLMGLILGFLIMLSNMWLFKKSNPVKIDSRFRKGQFLSAALYSIGHGANDAQKTMGIIFALLIASNMLSSDHTLSLLDPKTSWIIIACHIAMGVGTALGGWRIVKTMGMHITKLKPIGGFSAETAGTLSLYFATYTGTPVSTTHTIVSSIIGVGVVTNRFSGVKWGIAARIVWAWILTIPGSALIAGICFFAISLMV